MERRVLAHPAVQQAYVCTRRADEEGPNELLAFLVLGRNSPTRTTTATSPPPCPPYMRPHHIHLVAELPLNANGKVDQAALLREAATARGDRAAGLRGTGRDGDGRRVLDLAEEILGVTGLRLGDRWIASGGDSLKALRFRFAVRSAGAASCRRRPSCTATSPPSPGSPCHGPDPLRGERLPAPVASGARLGARHQRAATAVAAAAARPRAPVPTTSTRPSASDGRVDTACPRRALRSLVERHVALRTGFGPGPDGLQQTSASRTTPGTSRAPSGPGARRTAHTFADAFFADRFDLAVPRMLRACWLPRDDGGTLLLHLHHIAVDGWSLNILLRDLRPPTPRQRRVPPGHRGSDATAGLRRLAERPVREPRLRAQRDDPPARPTRAADREPPPARPGPAPRARLLRTSLDLVRRAAVDRSAPNSG